MKTITITRLNKQETDFDGIKWAISARGKSRPGYTWLDSVKIEDGAIVSTDANRMHCYAADRNIENGEYRVIKEDKNIIVLQESGDGFPNWGACFPDRETMHNGIVPFTVPDDKRDRLNAVCLRILKKTDHDYDVQYLVDACPPGETVRVFQPETADGPLLIETENKRALIMPLRD